MKNALLQSKPWIYFTSFILSLNGGYVNSVCLVSIIKNPVGYVTGNLTASGDSLARVQFTTFVYLLVLIACFLIGGIISGLMIKGENLKIDKRFTLSLSTQFLLVFISMILLKHEMIDAAYSLALTMGIQNGMTTQYGIASIRTTHVTGTTTDLSILLSRWLKGFSVEPWKIKLNVILMMSFCIGAILGAITYYSLHAYSLMLPLIVYSIMYFLTKIDLME